MYNLKLIMRYECDLRVQDRQHAQGHTLMSQVRTRRVQHELIRTFLVEDLFTTGWQAEELPIPR